MIWLHFYVFGPRDWRVPGRLGIDEFISKLHTLNNEVVALIFSVRLCTYMLLTDLWPRRELLEATKVALG